MPYQIAEDAYALPGFDLLRDEVPSISNLHSKNDGSFYAGPCNAGVRSSAPVLHVERVATNGRNCLNRWTGLSDRIRVADLHCSDGAESELDLAVPHVARYYGDYVV